MAVRILVPDDQNNGDSEWDLNIISTGYSLNYSPLCVNHNSAAESNETKSIMAGHCCLCTYLHLIILHGAALPPNQLPVIQIPELFR